MRQYRNGLRPSSGQRSRLSVLVQRLAGVRVLVVGDIMLDRFIYGGISRISPEAPVPVLRSERTEFTLGGAGNVVRNLIALGARPSFAGVVGEDAEGETVRKMLTELSGAHFVLAGEQQRRTTVKTRFIADRQQVLRVDSESCHLLEKTSICQVTEFLHREMEECQSVILSDYCKGFLCPPIIEAIISQARHLEKPVIVDPKGTDFTRYRGATIVTPNLKELADASHIPVNGDSAIVEAARGLISSCHLRAVVATRGHEGMSVVEKTGEAIHLKAEALEVFDVSGAGDTVIAVLAATVGVGVSLSEAAELANVAAGIVVGKVGTAVVHSQELIQALHHQELSSAEAKVLPLESALESVGRWRRQGYRVGFTNGVFDLLHHGHLSLLSQASHICDRLIVGLNSDLSVRRLTGEEPLQNETTRSAILASLELVDMVVIFDEDTPMRLLEALQPDMLIKGANYRIEEVVGGDFVRHYGGEVVLADVADIYATNSTIARMTKGIF
jgi:D-beta-D-heptose 7-phosphate kinase / D-beta-D-heptose 1-phosphate adenosyltransferase